MVNETNNKRWQKESDEWVKTMHASNERKQRNKEMSKVVGYKVEIIFTQDKTKDDPFEWLLEAVEEGKFKKHTHHVHATSVEPIDIDSEEYRWLANNITTS